MMCKYGYDKECFDCGECHEKHYCSSCEEEITEDEEMYQVGTEIYCEECLKEQFKV